MIILKTLDPLSLEKSPSNFHRNILCTIGRSSFETKCFVYEVQQWSLHDLLWWCSTTLQHVSPTFQRLMSTVATFFSFPNQW